MKVITQLSAQSIEGEVREPRGILNVAHFEPQPGIHIKVSLGSAGLVLRRGSVAAVFPHAVLFAAACSQCPELGSTAPAPKTPNPRPSPLASPSLDS